MRYQTVLTRVAEQCTQSPIEFTVEFDIQARIVEALRDKLCEEGVLNADFVDERIEYTGQTQNYKEGYVNHFLDKVGSAEDPFSRVHTEVAPYEELIEDLDSREHIDIVVFAKEMNYPIRWRGGSQRHHWDDYAAAIEVKYIKNKAKFPADVNDSEITGTSIEGLQSNLDFAENSIGPDIEELERLPDLTDRYLVLVSNHDYLYRGEIEDLDNTRQQRYSRLGRAAIKEIQRRSDGTNVLYVHPTGWQWITGNSIQEPRKPAPGETA